MRLAVTGLGMVSPVGRDVVTACASIRAGLRRPQEVPGSSVQSDPEAEAAPVIGYALHGFADGFAYLGLWLRMAERCLADVTVNGELAGRSGPDPWERTGLALVTPEIDPERYPVAEDFGLDALRENYGMRLIEATGTGILSENMWVVSQGHASTAVAAWQASQLIEAGRVDRVVVLAVDSYLDPFTLEWLARHDRLKSEENPAGLIPGEAAACLLLESEAAAAARGVPIQAVLLNAAASREPANFFTDDVNTGAELANVIGAVVPRESAFDGDLYVDLNGETWRGYAYGCARARLGVLIAEDARTYLPCDSLGEIGAAAGTAAACLAVRSFVRRYDRNGQALVVSSSEHGYVGAVLLARS